MRVANVKTVLLLLCFVGAAVSSGCTNWKKEYEALDAAYRNLEGRHQLALDEKGQLEEQLERSQREIEELQRQIAEQKKSPAEVTGFEGFDVAFDPAAGTITVTLPNTILFNPGKAELKKATSAQLDQIESVLRSKYGGKQIDVIGHTDSDPIKKSPWRDNWQLSAERALAVTDYLVKRGIPEPQIRAIGCGPARPVASNTTAAGKAKNRRVEIVVHMR